MHARPLRFAAALILATALAPVHAGPVTVSQDVTFAAVAPFGTFTAAAATAGGWTAQWPFTAAAQISSIVLTFATADPDFTNPDMFPTSNGGGTPGVEVGFIDESLSSRVAIASVSAAVPTIALTSAAGSAYTALVGSLLDGGVGFSLGAFVNFRNAVPAFSLPSQNLDRPSPLTVRVHGELPGAQTPEPASVALTGLALVAAGAAGAARRRLPKHA